MRCQKVRSYLSAYFKKELTARRHRAVEAHLDVCPDCRREETGIREMMGAIDKLPKTEVSADFNARLLNRIAQERFKETRTKAYLPKKAPAFGWSRIVPAVAATCLVLAVVLTGGINNLFDTPEQSQIADKQLDESYKYVLPADNPNLQNAYVQHVNANLDFKKELARANRIKNYMNSLTGYSRNYFSAQPTRLSSIIMNPERATVVMRLPFGQQPLNNSFIVVNNR